MFHFDCFWMREFNWCDFEWDPRVFPDPDGMLARLHEKDLRVCVWINPYIAQRSPLFAEAAGSRLPREAARRLGVAVGPLAGRHGPRRLHEPRCDRAGSRASCARCVDQGVDCFKTDFGERIPLEVDVLRRLATRSRMHNLYTQLYNEAVHDVLVEARGEGEAVLFARSATDRRPVDARALGRRLDVDVRVDGRDAARRALARAAAGSRTGATTSAASRARRMPAVFKRWTAFGLLGSHSRFHGSGSYRVPWAFDEEAVEVTRVFTHLKMRAHAVPVPAASLDAAASGVPIMRPMQLEFPDDPAVAYLDRQYMLGADILVAPGVHRSRARWSSTCRPARGRTC